MDLAKVGVELQFGQNALFGHVDFLTKKRIFDTFGHLVWVWFVFG
jgi:hypothetical protein